MTENSNARTQFCSETLKERDRTDDLRADGSIILKLTLKKLDDRSCTGITWLRKGKEVVGCRGNGNELTVCTNCEEVWTCGQIIRRSEL
jgi:hypothetical protein